MAYGHQATIYEMHKVRIIKHLEKKRGSSSVVRDGDFVRMGQYITLGWSRQVRPKYSPLTVWATDKIVRHGNA